MFVYSERSRELASALLRHGSSNREVARITGVALGTVRRWRRSGVPTRRRAARPAPSWRPPDAAAYAYLLGAYLGDGCLSTGYPTPELNIYMDGAYPQVVDEVERSIQCTIPGIRVHRHPRSGSRCVVIQAWHHTWLVAFPQHGPGRKHERKIELVDWQREITHAYPRELIRGLIHSDGCRTINRFSVDLPVGGRRTYEYARYFFSNLSADIRRIFTDHCDLLGVRWTLSNPRNVSISHRRSVMLLDDFVGAKT